MKKATIAKLLVVCLMLSMLCIPAGAEEIVPQATGDNNVCTLEKDGDVSKEVATGGAYTINLAGHKLTGGKITLTDSTSKLDVKSDDTAIISATGTAEVSVTQIAADANNSYTVNVSVTLNSENATFGSNPKVNKDKIGLGTSLSADTYKLVEPIEVDDNGFYTWKVEKYEPVTPGNVRVTFDLNGGTGTVADQTVSKGDKATEPTPAPTKDGYTFDGWFIGDTKYDFATPVTEDITLTAKWTAKTPDPEPAPSQYTVTFNPNYTGATATTAKVTAGGTVTKPADLTREGYTFAGWYRDAEGTTAWNFETDKVTADTVLYAKWTAATSTVNPAVEATPTVSAGTATAKVDEAIVDAEIKNAVNAAIEAAKENGEQLDEKDVNVDEVTIKATKPADSSETVTAAEVTLPVEAVNTLVDKKVTTVTVETDVGTVSLPQEVLTDEKGNAKTSDLKLVVEKTETTADKDVADQVVNAFKVEVHEGDGAAKIKNLKTPIKLRFLIGKELEKDKDYKLAFVDTENKNAIKKIAHSVYDAFTGYIEGTVDHLTEFVVVPSDAISDYYTISGTSDGKGGAGNTLVVNLTGKYDGTQVVTAFFTYKNADGSHSVISMTQNVVSGEQKAEFSYSGAPTEIHVYVSSSLPDLKAEDGKLGTTIYDAYESLTK